MPYKSPDTQRQYQATWMWRRRLAWIVENGPCAWCGSSQDLRVMYKDPSDRKVRVTSIWSLKDERRAELLAQCIVICRVCALSKRREERQPDHGMPGRYDQGCHCDPCKLAHNTKIREWRQRRKLKTP
jgi:hypothetical protein